MKILKKKTDIPVYDKAPFSEYFDPSGTGILDIETTGLSPAKSRMILAGLMVPENGTYTMHQYFAERPGEEAQVIAETAAVLKRLECVVTYNGRRFDIPFILSRMRENGIYELESAVPADVDVFRFVKYYSDIGKFVPNLKQKTLEDFMGLWTERDDEIDGGESVRLYYHYVKTGDGAAFEKILLHNADDICQLSKLMDVFRKTRFHEAVSNEGFPFRDGMIENASVKKNEFTVKGRQDRNPADYISEDFGGLRCRFRSSGGTFEIKGRLIERNGMRFFDTESLPGLGDVLKDDPACASGFIMVAEGERIDYRALNRLARTITERIKEDGLQKSS